VPRTREFDPNTLLEGAMHLFWEKGYEATSIRDIVEETGVNQFGIYSLYGDKQGLFLAVLDHYRDNIVSEVFGIVERPEASVRAIRDYFMALVERHTVILPALGCLMVNSIAECGMENAEIYQRTKAHTDRLRTGFMKALANALRNGEIRPDLNIDETANYLVVSAQGLAVNSRIYPDHAPLENFAATALSILDTPPKAG